MMSAKFSDFFTPSPHCHCHKSADFVSFVCFLGTPSPAVDVIYENPLTHARIRCTQDTCTMNGDEFTKTAEITVEMAYFTRDATTLARGDILRRLTRIWRHRRGGRVERARAHFSVAYLARHFFAHLSSRCLCIQVRSSGQEQVEVLIRPKPQFKPSTPKKISLDRITTKGLTPELERFCPV